MSWTTIVGLVVFGLMLVLILFAWVWAVLWYEDNPNNSESFSPGDLGSAMNFAVVIVTIALGYIAWRAYQVSQDQLKSLAVDQNRQLLERTLAAAIADFTKRLDSNRDDKVNKLTNTNAFLKAYERCIDYQVDEVKLAADERYQSFRTANYILKPLKYWCTG
ncbi:MAG: hypothetical protein IPF79_14890 [Ignavibacteria bacterium]|nr:hypothetical protein [Ignavibacteria bacterium]